MESTERQDPPPQAWLSHHDLWMPLPEIILSRELRALGMERQLRSWNARGIVRRIVPGAYARVAEWEALTADERYRLRVIATASLYPDNVFSHDSAAALWRLPSVGAWPDTVHAVAPRSAGGRSKAHIQRHCIGTDPDAVPVDGVTVTSLARTLADMACHRSFSRAVAMLDDGLRMPEAGEDRYGIVAPTKERVLLKLMELGRAPGYVRARRALEFADSGAQSPGESLSRVQIHALGLPAPLLQVEFSDSRGPIGTVDFFWPDLGLIGEFDGNSKYGDARRHARHLSPEMILLAEKEREDRLRGVSEGFVRWGWDVARDRRALGERLSARGLERKGAVRPS